MNVSISFNVIFKLIIMKFANLYFKTTGIIFFYFVFLIGNVQCDEYIHELRQRCKSTNSFFSCAKYGVLHYISNFTINDTNLTLSTGVVGLVKMNNIDGENGLFQKARQNPNDSELMKLFKFLQRQIDSFLRRQGLIFTLPEGVRLLNDENENSTAVEGRKKKDKKILILNLLILFKLFKIKMMIMSVSAGVMFIKKALIIGALFVPAILKSIKKHCRQDHYYVPHRHHIDEYYHHDHEHDHDHEQEDGGGYAGYWTEHMYPPKWD